MTWEPAQRVKSFITNTETQKTVTFQYFPVSLETIKDSSWEDQDNNNIVPYQEWKGGKHSINFPLQFSRRPDFNAAEAIVALREFADPMQRNGKFYPPATCLVHIGSGEWLVKVRKVHVSYTRWAPNGTSQDFDVVLECSEYMDVPKPPDKTNETNTSTSTKKEAKAPKPKAAKQEKYPYAYLTNQ